MNKLAMLWTTDNKTTAINMVLLYTTNSLKLKWWDECHLITWGASNELICKDQEVQEQIALAQEQGVKIYACKKCADDLGLAEKLESLGITLKYMGEPLTNYIRDEAWHVLSV